MFSCANNNKIMLQPYLSFLNRNKYKLAIIGLLLGASFFSVFLVIARMAYSDSQQYRGLIWNLFLAWIPFVLAYIAYALSWKRSWLLHCHPGLRLLVVDLLPKCAIHS